MSKPSRRQISETIAVHRPDGTARVWRRPDKLADSEVLPGFTLALDALFVD